MSENPKYRRFYNDVAPERWGRPEMPEQLSATRLWLDEIQMPSDSRVVELGCGHGALAAILPNWIGLDYSLPALASIHEGRRLQGDMQRLPFGDASIDGIVSWAAIEHVPRPELVLEEIERVLQPGGTAILAPAWHVRPWAAKGIATRPWSNLSVAERIERLTIPFRGSLVWRALVELPARLRGEIQLLGRRPIPFRYRRLDPNLDEYLETDSDAFTSMDPHAMIVYFLSRGWSVISHPSSLSRLSSRSECVVVRKPPVT